MAVRLVWTFGEEAKMAKETVSRVRRDKEKEEEKPTSRADNRVPELAENMEHTLRRLVREKERKRNAF